MSAASSKVVLNINQSVLLVLLFAEFFLVELDLITTIISEFCRDEKVTKLARLII